MLTFDGLSKYKWSALKTKSGFYAVRSQWNNGAQKAILMHREVIGASHFSEKVDHKNRDTLDNTRKNLRICTNAENCQNRGKTVRNTSGAKGVLKCRNRWKAVIRSNKVFHYLGVFDTILEYSIAYNKAASILHGEFKR